MRDEGTDLMEVGANPDRGETLRDSGSDAGRCCPAGFPGPPMVFEGGWSPTGDCPEAGIYDPGCDCSIVKDDHGCDRLVCATPFQQCFGDAGARG